MTPRTIDKPSARAASSRAAGSDRLNFNADTVAIALAIALAALIRLGIIHRIGW